MECTPLKEINVSVEDSPRASSQPTNEISNFTLRKLNGQGSQIIDTINSELKLIQLKSTDRLLTRLKNEISGTVAAYKKLKGGHQKTLFDRKMRQLNVQENEIISANSSCSKTISLPDTCKRIDNISTPNRGKVVNKLKNSIEKSLDFVKSYGVLPKKLFYETFDGKSGILNVDGTITQNISYENLSSSAKMEVKSMLNVCDKSMVSDAAYHELSMQIPSMPRSHHVKACRNEINAQFEVHRTPGMIPGSYLSLKSELSKIIHEFKVSETDSEEKLKIKLSGDGAKVSRVSNFLVLSFSVLGENSSSHMRQHVLAIVNCDENYSNLKQSLGPLFDEINELNSQKYIAVDGQKVNLEIFIGGDMKFIQLLLGMNSSIATYACPWCKVTKECRGDISRPRGFYHGQNMTRSISEMKTCNFTSAKANFGSETHPC